jgi:DNA-binding transcriptional MerR regulator
MTISQGELVLAPSHSSVSSRRTFTIAQLAQEFGLTLRALRFYGDRGLLSPKRDGNSRVYTPDDRERLSVILQAKALGFTLAEIADTLGTKTAQSDATGLSLTSSQVADQIAHLEQQKAKIESALAELQTLRARVLTTRAAQSPRVCARTNLVVP